MAKKSVSYYALLKSMLYGHDLDYMKNDRSPNEIRSIFLDVRGILIVYHTSMPKFVMVDPESFSKEFQKKPSGCLNNVLNKYKLSCLEEIYVNSFFRQYMGYVDLVKFVNDLGAGSTKKRIRAAGYFNNFDIQTVNDVYRRVVQAHDYMYTFYKDKGFVSSCGVQFETYEGTVNKDWYKNYALRPADYSKDKVNGVLDQYFKRVSADVEKKVSAAVGAMEAEGRKSLINALVAQENSYIMEYKRELLAIRAAKYRMKVSEIIAKEVNDVLPIIVGTNYNKGTVGIIIDEKGLQQVGEKEARALGFVPEKMVKLSECSLEDLKERVENGRGLYDSKVMVGRKVKALFSSMRTLESTVKATRFCTDIAKTGCDTPADIERGFSMVVQQENPFIWYSEVVAGMLYFRNMKHVMSVLKNMRRVESDGKG